MKKMLSILFFMFIGFLSYSNVFTMQGNPQQQRPNVVVYIDIQIAPPGNPATRLKLEYSWGRDELVITGFPGHEVVIFSNARNLAQRQIAVRDAFGPVQSHFLSSQFVNAMHDEADQFFRDLPQPQQINFIEDIRALLNFFGNTVRILGGICPCSGSGYVEIRDREARRFNGSQFNGARMAVDGAVVVGGYMRYGMPLLSTFRALWNLGKDMYWVVLGSDSKCFGTMMRTNTGSPHCNGDLIEHPLSLAQGSSIILSDIFMLYLVSLVGVYMIFALCHFVEDTGIFNIGNQQQGAPQQQGQQGRSNTGFCTIL